MRRILLLAFALAAGLPHASAQSDQEIQASAQRALHAYSLTTIESSVHDAAITLTGSVKLCRDRLLAVQMMNQIQGVKAVEDLIEVLGPEIADAQLKTQIDRIISDRIHRLGGFGFGSMTARLKDGVVTLAGTATKTLAEPAIDAIAGISGVRNLIDHVRRVPNYDPNWRSNPGVSSHVVDAALR